MTWAIGDAASRPAGGRLLAGLRVQCAVVGALILRELHTRYGRENIGYLWMIGEPMLLAVVIGIMHLGGKHSVYLGDIQPVPFAVLGYTTFMLFRGIVNRAAGSLEANAPLLYHRQVTVLDLIIARGFLEFASTFLTMSILMFLLVAADWAQPPIRPLVLFAAWGLIFWYALGHALLITALSYENRTFERLVHPYSYFMVGLSASFFQVGWMPPIVREILGWIPLTSLFELMRYGWFRGTNLDYFHGQYAIAVSAFMTWSGLIMLRRVQHKIHLT
jgi:capsular polysaccharide transport system permease protein